MSKHPASAASRQTGRTRRLPGWLCVKIGSKMAARYKMSKGEVCDEAMTVPGPGRRPRGVCARDLCLVRI